jgi:hypothetical protein
LAAPISLRALQMINRTFHSFASALRQLLRRWGTLLILFALYLAMLGAIYWFFVTREATVAQVLLSLLLALTAPVLFLIIQTMAARYNDAEHGWSLLKESLRDFWKLLVVALPLIAVAVILFYLFDRSEPGSTTSSVREAMRATPAVRAPAPKPKSTDWQVVAVTTLQYLIFCLVLPLAAIHLWIATAREGLKQTLRRAGRILARAFAPQSVLTYAIGFIFFALIPYVLIVTKTPLANPMLEATLLGVRLALAVAFSLIGWVVTVAALGELAKDHAASVAKPNEGTGHVPAEA